MMYTVYMNTAIASTSGGKPLTDQQRIVLAFVGEFSDRHGFPPTLREIGDAVGLTHTNAVRGHLAALEKKGYIARTPDKARSIRVVHAPSAFSRFKRKLHEVLHTDEGVFHRVVYGLAWTTWRGTPCLTGAQAEEMAEALDREAVEHGWTILDKKVEPDHVLVVVQAWPNHSPQQTVHRFQSAGKVLRRRKPERFPGDKLWGRGYVVTTDVELLDELAQKLLRHQDSEAEGEQRKP